MKKKIHTVPLTQLVGTPSSQRRTKFRGLGLEEKEREQLDCPVGFWSTLCVGWCSVSVQNVFMKQFCLVKCVIVCDEVVASDSVCGCVSEG